MVEIDGVFACGGADAFTREWPSPYSCAVTARWRETEALGPPVGSELRAAGLAEHAVLVEGALEAAGIDRASLTSDPTLLDSCVVAPSGASAGARVHIDAASGALERVEVRVAAGRSARRDGAPFVRGRRRTHGARLGLYRVTDGRSRHR